MAQLARGFRVVRTDLRWNLVQPKGAGHSYDWSLYDGLLARLAANEIVPLLILDRPPIGGAPSTPSAAASFAQFAVDAVRRYRGCVLTPRFERIEDTTDRSTPSHHSEPPSPRPSAALPGAPQPPMPI